MCEYNDPAGTCSAEAPSPALKYPGRNALFSDNPQELKWRPEILQLLRRGELNNIPHSLEGVEIGIRVSEVDGPVAEIAENDTSRSNHSFTTKFFLKNIPYGLDEDSLAAKFGEYHIPMESPITTE
ncbi:hypothetical protein MVEN_00039100 [Mycena venus]|uniref:Uncharacterized protein n=1 Tax=Mycena venus TaxID=2733690 RepID=A0A8H6Z749_9AGAR|nr:hypothetical protein MVEN_00039100 [Mycena venus]